MALIIIFAILVIDQIIKIVVKTNMSLGQSIHIADWFQILFVENVGMAYGMTFINKLTLSLFRLVAISFIAYYLYRQVKAKARTRYVVLLSMVLAGAAGNMIDSMFYGLVFSTSSPYYVAYAVPFGTGYADFLMGKVVDMFYFPIIHTTWPEWVPWVGGDEYIFFSPIFNFADASISVAIILLLIFCREELNNLSLSFSLKKKDESNPQPENNATPE